MSKGSKKRWNDDRKERLRSIDAHGPEGREDMATIRRLERERSSGRSRANKVHGFAPPAYDVSPVAMY